VLTHGIRTIIIHNITSPKFKATVFSISNLPARWGTRIGYDNVAGCQIYSISGAYDLLALINLDDEVDPGMFVTQKLQKVPGIAETNTMLAFNAFTPSGKL
jgi:DNA-binding Lrp family transcriptional regulator